MSVPVPEPIVERAYCRVSDLRTGDIRLPAYISKEQRIQAAAEEIDIALGHLYVTPITFPLADAHPEQRPSVLAVKKMNWLIASGRLILDLAAASEDATQHAYGMGMLKEGLEMLKAFATGKPKLDGAVVIPEPEGNKNFTGPVIHNEDPVSLVESFYAPRDIFGQRQGAGIPYGFGG